MKIEVYINVLKKHCEEENKKKKELENKKELRKKKLETL